VEFDWVDDLRMDLDFEELDIDSGATSPELPKRGERSIYVAQGYPLDSSHGSVLKFG
jgi:hypothetical protein